MRRTPHRPSTGMTLQHLLGSFCLGAASAGVVAEAKLYTDLDEFNAALLQSAEVFITSPANIAKANEVDSPPGANRAVGAVTTPGQRTLTFDRSNTGLDVSFEFTALDSEFLTYDDDEGNGNLADFDGALSPGDIDNDENDDWRVRLLPAQTPLRAFGFFLQNNNSSTGEVIKLFSNVGRQIDELAVGSLPLNTFVGVISDEPFFEFRYDEGAGGDDIAVKDFRFFRDRNPVVVDVYAATPRSTAGSPQSVQITMEGSALVASPLEYQVRQGPFSGGLVDPNDPGAPIVFGAPISQTLTYTPDPGFTGIDTFRYGASSSRSSLSGTVTITVLEGFRPAALQIGNDLDGENGGDLSGAAAAVSRDGTTVAIGARRNDGADTDAGHVRMYRRFGDQWVRFGPDIDGQASEDFSGSSVALSSNGLTVAIGAPGSDRNAPTSGKVVVYVWDGREWEQLGDDINGASAGDESGDAVSLSSDGRTVAIGAGSAAGGFGHARVFRWNDNAWVQLGGTIIGESAGDRSGEAISLSSDGLTVAIGAARNQGNGFDSGHVRVFRYDLNGWAQLGEDIDGENFADRSGSAVSLSSDGATLAVGAPRNSGNGTFSGHVRVFTWDGSAWTQLGDDIDGEAERDESGGAVSLSSDGRTLAIGAQLNDGSGENAGHARVYRWAGSNWEQVGRDIDGEGGNDSSGEAVALSGDGQTLAVGARANGDFNSGHVRVFDLSVSADDDEDGDGVNNGMDDCDDTPAQEVSDINSEGCGPSERDTDDDGVNDSDDAFPDDPSETADSDDDGLGDNREGELGTDPNLADTDDDGFSDGEEVEAQSDPLSPREVPPPTGLNIILIKAAIDSRTN
ncbi:MAG: hypothetical protein AAFY29_20950 [Pseudomonadota bacterium]